MKTKSLTSGLLLIVTALSAHGASRSSTDYSVPADTLDDGGRRTASANYFNDGSVSGEAGISTVAAPAEVAKHGFVGQLYDVASLTLAANPTNVNEAGPRQLSATAQDFYAAFGLGEDGRHITTVDESGVALAAIQGLNQKVETAVKEKDARIAELERRLAALEQLLKASTK